MAILRAEIILQIEPPTNCPSCSSVLEWSNDTLYCRNTSCSAKSFKQVEHFAKTLKIKGLGPVAIEKLDISSIIEIYDITLDYATRCLGSEKIALKLLDEIERSKCESLNIVLPAFGITLVGNSAAAKLSTVCTSIFDINTTTCKQAGLGNVVTSNLLSWLDNEFEKYCELPFNFEFANNKSSIESRGIICITGKLISFATKAEATKILEELGYTVKKDLTKEVTILVNESGVETAKTLKAASNGVQIVKNLIEFIGE